MESVTISTVNTTTISYTTSNGTATATTTATVTASISSVSGTVTSITVPTVSGLAVGLTLSYTYQGADHQPHSVSENYPLGIRLAPNGSWQTPAPWQLQLGTYPLVNPTLVAWTYQVTTASDPPARASSPPVPMSISASAGQLLRATAGGGFGGGQGVTIESPSPGQTVSSGFVASGTINNWNGGNCLPMVGTVTVGGSTYPGTVLQQPTSTDLDWQIQFPNPSSMACAQLSVSTSDGGNAQQTQGGCYLRGPQ